MRCRNLWKNHRLELVELIAIWEAQDGCCYRCRELLTDPRIPVRGMGSKGPDGTWTIKIDHDHKICGQGDHSCNRCRRGLACHHCNVRALSVTTSLPESEDGLVWWLEFLGPADRDRLRSALTLFPEQPVRRVSRRRPAERATGETVAALFDLDAYRPPA